MGTVELLVGIVLGVDALIVVGVVASRLSGRRARRTHVPSVDAERLASITARPGMASATATADRAAPDESLETPSAPIAGAASEPAVSEPALGPDPGILETGPEMLEPGPEMLEPGSEILEPGPEMLEPGSEILETAAEAGPRSSEVGPQPEPGSAVAHVDPAAAQAGSPPSPLGLDFAPTWVDPMTMAAAAASEWRRGLRRDLARAARRGRPALVMHVKLDVEGRSDLTIQELARLEGVLQETIATRVRDGDYLDRTGPGRFHMILSEMPESGAVAVADRIIHAYREDAPDGPRLLIGWAAMETEGDIGLALQRAAERVADSSMSLPGDPPPG